MKRSLYLLITLSAFAINAQNPPESQSRRDKTIALLIASALVNDEILHKLPNPLQEIVKDRKKALQSST